MKRYSERWAAAAGSDHLSTISEVVWAGESPGRALAAWRTGVRTC